jgi:azurin
MKFLTSLIIAGFLATGPAAYAAEDKAAPEVKTVCVDVQGKDGKAVIDPKTKKPKQNCTKVKVRKKHEGTKIEDAKKK